MTKSTFAHGQLRTIVERIERLEEEKKTIAGDIKEVYAEAKGNGFDTKILRKVIALRKKDAAERQEEEAMIDVYINALDGAAGEGNGVIDRETENVDRDEVFSSAGFSKTIDDDGDVVYTKTMTLTKESWLHAQQNDQPNPAPPSVSGAEMVAGNAAPRAAGDNGLPATAPHSESVASEPALSSLQDIEEIHGGGPPSSVRHEETAGSPRNGPAVAPVNDDIGIPDFLKRKKPSAADYLAAG
jgi:uncharacterized protein (UPF0335 family)